VKRVYIAALLQEAHLIEQKLRAARIDAHIFNEHASGGLGELPVTLPEIWVSDDRDVELARKLINAHERQNQRAQHDVHCATCGELNPANFELCWRCDAGLETVS